MWTGPSLTQTSPNFGDNRTAMLDAVGQLRALETRTAQKSEQRRARFHRRGQITPGERLGRLVDPGLPFCD